MIIPIQASHFWQCNKFSVITSTLYPYILIHRPSLNTFDPGPFFIDITNIKTAMQKKFGEKKKKVRCANTEAFLLD